MKASFYPKFAWDGIRKNNRLYVPYILTCTGMVTMYYIIVSLSASPLINSLRGGPNIITMLDLGSWVILIFALIFLFYTNSFLSRRRTKEFGLYNILGMGKRNIARILFWETLIASGIALIAGNGAGIVLSKLAELGLVNIMKEEVSYTLSVSGFALGRSTGLFATIFFLIFLNTLRRIRSASPVELLHSESLGEKPPKTNWFFGALGAVLLGAAYYIAVSIDDPLAALNWFFAAVVMVVIGSYLLFIAGSVVFCRLLQKKKKYYYKPNHFVSVSSMVYRMKRNGAGLASICILATMVLVMISSTASLYFGTEDSLMNRYPRQINLSTNMLYPESLGGHNLPALRAEFLRIAAAEGAVMESITDYRLASVVGVLENNAIEVDLTKLDKNGPNAKSNIYKVDQLRTFTNIYQIYIMPLEDYNRIMGTNETLAADECLIYTAKEKYAHDMLAINGGSTFKIKKHLATFFSSGDTVMNIISPMHIVVPNLDAAIKGISDLTDSHGNKLVALRWNYSFDTQLDEENQIALNAKLHEAVKEFNNNGEYGIDSYSVDSRAANRGDFYGTYGGLFFLGVLLSMVFIFAAVLIIYYKQISEGYEDRARFDIMQKVGMTKKEIRKNINSQLLTIFFLPLVGAGLHLTFAFPIIRRLLLLFALNDVALFAIATVICFLVFALFYTLVYRITSNAYYAIVSGAKET
ncbi:MAG: ABC transporter permease [Oscillospiraceae bacterium]|jgi:putative ABC transport system permease protein|nr:ABC transporter permease [Oscillospiraceae bacterium]